MADTSSPAAIGERPCTSWKYWLKYDRADEGEEHDQCRDVRSRKRGLQEEGNIDQWLGTVVLPGDERDQRGHPGGERSECRARGQASDLAVNDAVGERRYGGRGEDRAEPVKVARAPGSG
jgi:hypothetical protein